ncbi:MAG: insulinase family protein [Roseobacter sp.]|uniref:insulinase family protein n=1 Tax=Tateyamaria sp. TaxID=1929288 RepID=UPI0032833F5B
MHESFEIIDARFVQNINGNAVNFLHKATGAEVLTVRTDDTELVFGIMVETLPDSSNGIAHVLEHLIFRGSKKYPTTNLYTALLQGTLLTGLNASTTADSTLFHVSSGHPDDLANLIDILLNTVFDPLLLVDDILEERDIVVNEMIGHQAASQTRILEELRQSLLPHTVYSLDYGGAPDMIETLTPQQLRDFHAANYRSDRTKLFLWGDIDVHAYLSQLDDLLRLGGTSDHTGIHSSNSLPEFIDIPWSVSSAVGSEQMVGLGWAFELENSDLWRALSIDLVAEPGGQLKRALLDRGLSLIGPGYSAETPVGTFEIAVMGDTLNTGPPAISLTQQLFEQFAENDIPFERMTLAVDRLELQLRNLGRSSPAPQGLRALNMIRSQWLNGANPLVLLDVSERMFGVREALKTNPRSFQQLVASDLLDNPHRILLFAEPKAVRSLTTPSKTRVRPILDPRKRSSPTNLPSLNYNSMQFQVNNIDTEIADGVINIHRVKPELCRAELAVSLDGLDEDEMELVPLLASLLTRANKAQNIEISVHCQTALELGTSGTNWMFLSGKSLPSAPEYLLAQMHDIIHLSGFDKNQVHERIKAGITSLNAKIASAGHIYCEKRLHALSGSDGSCNERLNGISQTRFLKSLLEHAPDQVHLALARLKERLIQNSGLHLAISGIEPATATRFFTPRHMSGQKIAKIPDIELPLKEGIPTTASNFTLGQAVTMGAPASSQVIARMLETGWLWESIRVAGGAYSTRVRYNLNDGLLALISIRDPNSLTTLDRFQQAPIWLEHNASSAFINQCIQATVSNLARAERPDDIVGVALQRHLKGETDEMRKGALDEICSVTPRAVNHASQKMADCLPDARTVVLGAKDKLCVSLRERPGAFELRPDS